MDLQDRAKLCVFLGIGVTMLGLYIMFEAYGVGAGILAGFIAAGAMLWAAGMSTSTVLKNK